MAVCSIFHLLSNHHTWKVILYTVSVHLCQCFCFSDLHFHFFPFSQWLHPLPYGTLKPYQVLQFFLNQSCAPGVFYFPTHKPRQSGFCLLVHAAGGLVLGRGRHRDLKTRIRQKSDFWYSLWPSTSPQTCKGSRFLFIIVLVLCLSGLSPCLWWHPCFCPPGGGSFNTPHLTDLPPLPEEFSFIIKSI